MVQTVDPVPGSVPNRALASVGWLAMSAGAALNLWLAFLVLEWRYGGRSGAAQADFELFILIFSLGGPVAIVSLAFFAAISLTKIRAKNYLASVAKSPAALVCLFNIGVPAGLLAYLLANK